jgi:hypothetical protein
LINVEILNSEIVGKDWILSARISKISNAKNVAKRGALRARTELSNFSGTDWRKGKKRNAAKSLPCA